MKPRRLASWLASPTAYASVQLARQTRCRVLAGPFAGMRYPPSFVARGLFPTPYQAGSFECELHRFVEEIASAAPGVIVNVGSAEGYYAVGFARRLAGARVIAFEADPRARAACARIAALNGVEARVAQRGACTTAELAALAPELDGRNPCVIIDCEGCEAELADPEPVPWLERARLLVELHPNVEAEIGSRIAERMAPTHETEIVRGEPRWAARFPELWRIRGLRQIDRELVVAEYRHGIQEWLWAVPRTPAAG